MYSCLILEHTFHSLFLCNSKSQQIKYFTDEHFEFVYIVYVVQTIMGNFFF